MNRKGFTLIELVIILVLLAIIGVFAAPRMLDVTSTKAEAFADKLRADIRYAQTLAMTSGLRHRVYFNNAPAPMPDGYIVVNDANIDGWGAPGGNEIAQDPAGGGNLSVILDAGDYAGITITAVGFAGAFVEFDSLGTPYDGGGILNVASSVTASGGGTNTTITVQPQTGAVN